MYRYLRSTRAVAALLLLFFLWPAIGYSGEGWGDRVSCEAIVAGDIGRCATSRDPIGCQSIVARDLAHCSGAKDVAGCQAIVSRDLGHCRSAGDVAGCEAIVAQDIGRCRRSLDIPSCQAIVSGDLGQCRAATGEGPAPATSSEGSSPVWDALFSVGEQALNEYSRQALNEHSVAESPKQSPPKAALQVSPPHVVAPVSPQSTSPKPPPVARTPLHPPTNWARVVSDPVFGVGEGDRPAAVRERFGDPGTVHGLDWYYTSDDGVPLLEISFKGPIQRVYMVVVDGVRGVEFLRAHGVNDDLLQLIGANREEFKKFFKGIRSSFSVDGFTAFVHVGMKELKVICFEKPNTAECDSILVSWHYR